MKKAIILEDDFIVGLFLKNQLEKLGIHVAARLDRGEDLAESVIKHRPDILLIDIELYGDIDGVEAAKTLSEKNRNKIVFITGASLRNISERVRDVQPLALLSKPVNISDIASIIKNI